MNVRAFATNSAIRQFDRPWVKRAIHCVVLAACISHLAGCTTMAVVEEAQGHLVKDESGVVVGGKESKPAYYLLLPLTIPFDVFITLLSLEGGGFGYYHHPSSGGGGLNISRH